MKTIIENQAANARMKVACEIYQAKSNDLVNELTAFKQALASVSSKCSIAIGNGLESPFSDNDFNTLIANHNMNMSKIASNRVLELTEDMPQMSGNQLMIEI